MTREYQILEGFNKQEEVSKEKQLEQMITRPGKIGFAIKVFLLLIQFALNYFYDAQGNFTWKGFWNFTKKSVRKEFRNIFKNLSDLLE